MREGADCWWGLYPDFDDLSVEGVRLETRAQEIHRRELEFFASLLRETEFFIDNLLVRIHFIIVMVRWTGLAPRAQEIHRRELHFFSSLRREIIAAQRDSPSLFREILAAQRDSSARSSLLREIHWRELLLFASLLTHHV